MELMAPIPGQSLTHEPGSVPWENPPQYNTPEESLGFYFEALEDEEKLDDLIFLTQLGVSLQEIVNWITSLGVMEGKHTFDVKVLIMPILHEHLKMLFETAGIDFVEWSGKPKEEKMKEKEKQRVKALLMKALQSGDPSPENVEEATQALSGQEEAPPDASGFIPRRV